MKTIFWDFDGTLVLNSKWSRSIIDTLDERYPGHGFTHQRVGAFLNEDFPWHFAERYHPELCTSEAWWGLVKPLLARGFIGVGYGKEESAAMSEEARQKILQSSYYTLYDDTFEVLETLKQKGWRHFVLSNNYPEMPEIVNGMSFGHLFDGVISSGMAGYDKPNPGIYKFALELAGNPDTVWMVGDNIKADVWGAEAMGIPAILVREPTTESVKYYAADLRQAAEIIEKNS